MTIPYVSALKKFSRKLLQIGERPVIIVAVTYKQGEFPGIAE